MSKFLQVGVEGGEGVKYGVGIEGGSVLVHLNGGDWAFALTYNVLNDGGTYECGSQDF